MQGGILDGLEGRRLRCRGLCLKERQNLGL